ncbi:vitamin K epoxide reductase family protein [Saccharomonospora sp. NPDC046836]|uniref:vitamin K epoxide reductase family protein n=1 Tax=Saccharomonospora sp. NPDC046836 TaxID=3156921 RepID=UPI0033C2B6ED
MSVSVAQPVVESRVPTRLVSIVAWVLTVGGIIGSVAAFVLTVEKIALLENPFYQPSCSIDATLSCGSVMQSAQAAAFGFPNPILGVAGFPIVTTVGVALLAGARLPRWFWLGLQAGTLFGVGFVHWLITQSLYEIGALCPYCLAVWAVTIPIFWYTTVHNLAAGYLPGGRALGEVLARRHLAPLLFWLLLIVILVLQRFWSYFSGLVS